MPVRMSLALQTFFPNTYMAQVIQHGGGRCNTRNCVELIDECIEV